jgi:hypothetical protein
VSSFGAFSIKAAISEYRQTVIRFPNLIGSGNLPLATPDHQVERETGIRGGIPRLASPQISEILNNLSSGSTIFLAPILNEISLLCVLKFLADIGNRFPVFQKNG